MAFSADELLIRIKLSGAREAAGEAKIVSGSIAEIGNAAKKANASSGRSLAQIGQKFDTVGKKMDRVGKKMTHVFTTPILGAVGASAYLAANFDRNMELIHTQAGDTQKAVGVLSKQVLALGMNSAQGPIELSKALFRLEGAGLRGSRAMKALKAASDLAAVGNANVEDTAKTLSQAWFVNIKGAGTFQNTVAQLNATVGAGDLRLQQLVDALGTGVLASAKHANLAMQDVNAALAVFGDETNNVSGWAAQFATALHFITTPGLKATNALADLGLKQFQLANDMRKPNGLSAALHDLRNHLEAMPGGAKGNKAASAINAILPGGRGRVLLVLLNQLDRLDKKYKQIAGTTGQFGDAVRRTNQQPLVQFHKALAQIEVAGIQLGNAVLPTLTKLIQQLARAVTSVVRWFNHLTTGQKKFVEGAVIFLAALGPVVRVFGNLARAIGGVTKAAGWLGKKFGLLATESEASAAKVAATSGKWAAAGSVLGTALGVGIVLAVSNKVQDWFTSTFGQPLPGVGVVSNPGGLNPKNWVNPFHPNAPTPPVVVGPHGIGITPGYSPTRTRHVRHPQAQNAPPSSSTPHSGRKVAVGPQMAMAGGGVIGDVTHVHHTVVNLDGRAVWESWDKEDRKKKARR